MPAAGQWSVPPPTNTIEEQVVRLKAGYTRRQFTCRCTNCSHTYVVLLRTPMRKSTLCRSCVIKERYKSPEAKQRLSNACRKSYESGRIKYRPYIDLVGQRFGRLVVESYAGIKGKKNSAKRLWNCVCDCGNKSLVRTGNLRSGISKSCGYCNPRGSSLLTRTKLAGLTEKEKRRSSVLIRQYNLTIEDYDKILSYQGGVCPITGKPSKRYAVDHDHKTGLVRGVIDWLVNQALAHFGDDPDLLRRAADYLDNPPAVSALGEEVYGVMGRVTKKAKHRRYGPLGTKEPQPRKKSEEQLP